MDGWASTSVIAIYCASERRFAMTNPIATAMIEPAKKQY
jgi:hypothetical protein